MFKLFKPFLLTLVFSVFFASKCHDVMFRGTVIAPDGHALETVFMLSLNGQLTQFDIKQRIAETINEKRHIVVPPDKIQLSSMWMRELPNKFDFGGAIKPIPGFRYNADLR